MGELNQYLTVDSLGLNQIFNLFHKALLRNPQIRKSNEMLSFLELHGAAQTAGDMRVTAAAVELDAPIAKLKELEHEVSKLQSENARLVHELEVIR